MEKSRNGRNKMKYNMIITDASFKAVNEIKEKFFKNQPAWSFSEFLNGCIVFKHTNGKSKAFSKNDSILMEITKDIGTRNVAKCRSINYKHGWHSSSIN